MGFYCACSHHDNRGQSANCAHVGAKMSLLALLSFSLLLAVNFAAVPKPPKLEDFFEGTGDVRIDLGDKNVTGTCNYNP